MKHFRFLLPLIFLSCTASFCVKDPVIPEVPGNSTMLEVSLTDTELMSVVEFGTKDAVEFTVWVKTTDPNTVIEATSNELWFHPWDFDLGSYNGVYTIGKSVSDIFFKEGVESDYGTITVTVRNENEEVTRTVRVEKMHMTIPTQQLDFRCEGGTQSLNIESNFPFKVEKMRYDEIMKKDDGYLYWVEVPSDFCDVKLTEASGSNPAVLTVTMAPRDKGVKPRKLELKLTDKDEIFTTYITVTQDGIDWRAAERAALCDIYEQMGGKDWVESTNWCTNAPLDTWRGIELDEEGHVYSIMMCNNNVTGEIPSSIGDFTGLYRLNLHDNHITGTIPETISNCFYLFDLELDRNQMSGPFPEAIRKIRRSIRWLCLAHNSFTGPLPEWLSECSKMTDFTACDNRFSGQIPPSLLGCRWWYDHNIMQQQEGYVLYK